MQINQKIKGGDIKQLIEDQRSILRSLENIIKEPNNIIEKIRKIAPIVYDDDIVKMLELIQLEELEYETLEEQKIIELCIKFGLKNLGQLKKRPNIISKENKESAEKLLNKWIGYIKIDLGIFFWKFRYEIGEKVELRNQEKDLIHFAYMYVQYFNYAEEARQLLMLYKEDVLARISALDGYGSSLRLMIQKREQKEKIRDAYMWFVSGNGETYVKRAQLCINQSIALQKKERDSVVEEQWNDLNSVWTTLYQLVPEYMNKTGNMYKSYYLDIYNEAIKTKENIDLINQAYAEAEQKIIKSVHRTIAPKVKEKVNAMPISDLNIYGAKTTALEDYGFTKIGEIMEYSKSRFMQMPGIGEKSAESIIDAIEQIREKATVTVKFKLSEDNKNADTSEVVKNIVKYMDIAYVSQQMNQGLSEWYQPPITEQIDFLGYINSFKNWLLLDSEYKSYGEFTCQSVINFLNSEWPYWLDTELTYIKNQEISDAEAWQKFHDNPTNFYNILEKLVPEVLGDSNRKGWLSEKMFNEIQDEIYFPDGLLVTLRKYQEIGVKYLLHQEDGILGDDMGLGKSIQILACMVSLKNCGESHFMVICPASVINNWCREIEQKTRLRYFKIHGDAKKQGIKDWYEQGGVAVTNFESLNKISLPENGEFKIGMLAVDEAHYIKNENTKRRELTEKMCEKAKRKILLTGTAIENNVMEMISLISILRPDIANEAMEWAAFSTSDKFKEVVAPVYFRRKKEDVLTELPDLEETYEYLQMGKREEEKYEKNILERESAMKIRRLSFNVDLDYSCKAQRILEIVKEAKESDRKIIIFSYFIDTIDNMHTYLNKKIGKGTSSKPIKGNVPVDERAKIIKDFEKAPAGTVLLSQINSGGTGLNIQSASVVIICEPQYKPSIENQAIGRAHRIGQTRNVLAYHLICENTIEEGMVERLMEKQKEFDEFADESVAAQRSEEFNDKKFGELIQEEIDRINEKRRSCK